MTVTRERFTAKINFNVVYELLSGKKNDLQEKNMDSHHDTYLSDYTSNRPVNDNDSENDETMLGMSGQS